MRKDAHVIRELKARVAESKRRKLARDQRAEFRSFVASLGVMSDSSSLIREDRDREHR